MSNPKGGALRPFQPCRFARYTLLNPIAKGGMGEVFLAQMTGAGGFEKLIIIKKILPELAREKDFVDRFLAEAKMLVQLHHGSIAQILDMGVEAGSYYIAMEFVDGKDLRKVLQRARELKSPVPTGLALHIIIRILDALAYSHRKILDDGSELNLVHRDVSPQNILVSYEGDVKLIDFGLAKSSESQKQKTRAGMIVGKIFYMAPEQTMDVNVDRRCDLYAAGICLWEMLAGRNPFDTGESAMMLMHHVAEPDVPSIRTIRPDLPQSLDDVLRKAIEPDPDDRFSSAEEMRAALTAVMLQVDPMAGPESLAGLMRRMFSAELEKEHRNIAAMLKVAPKPEDAQTGSQGAKPKLRPSFPSPSPTLRPELSETRGEGVMDTGKIERPDITGEFDQPPSREASLEDDLAADGEGKTECISAEEAARGIEAASARARDEDTDKLTTSAVSRRIGQLETSLEDDARASDSAGDTDKRSSEETARAVQAASHASEPAVSGADASHLQENATAGHRQGAFPGRRTSTGDGIASRRKSAPRSNATGATDTVTEMQAVASSLRESVSRPLRDMSERTRSGDVRKPQKRRKLTSSCADQATPVSTGGLAPEASSAETGHEVAPNEGDVLAQAARHGLSPTAYIAIAAGLVIVFILFLVIGSSMNKDGDDIEGNGPKPLSAPASATVADRASQAQETVLGERRGQGALNAAKGTSGAAPSAGRSDAAKARKKAAAPRRDSPMTKARALLKDPTPPESMDDVTQAFDGLTEELDILREGFGCQRLSMMCDFHAGLKIDHEKLLKLSGEKVPPEDLPQIKRRFWEDLKLLAASLDEQRGKLERGN